jgi:hypothetical protein
MDDANKFAEDFTEAVRKAFVKVYGRSKDVDKVQRSILASYSERGEKLRWVPPDPDVVLVLTEFAWVQEPYSSDQDMRAWGKVIAELKRAGWPAAWDSINAAVQIVFVDRHAPGVPPPSMGAASGGEKPVAKVQLDTRAHGPFLCTQCSAENEDAILMTDGRLVCPDCGTPMEEFQPWYDLVVSVAPVKRGDVDMRRWHCCDDQCRSRGCRWEKK